MTEGITTKLINIQKNLKAPKEQNNTFGKYKYRSAEDILEAVKPINAEQGLLLTLSDEPYMAGEWHYIKATATITDGKDSLSVTAFARESPTKKGMDDSQITGTASSYARKYALNGLYLIDDTKDADTDEYQNQNKQQTNNQQSNNQQPNKPVGKASDKQLDFAKKLIKGKVSDEYSEPQIMAMLAEKLKVNVNMAEWTPGDASKVIKKLQEKKKE